MRKGGVRAPARPGLSRVRILAGRWKGRRLEVPPRARPTSGRAREALFAILRERVPGARVLDLYAGSGALGLEAVSRGAARAVLVEREPGALARNLALLAPETETVELLPLEASTALAGLERRGERFEIVFADPPYAEGAAPGVAGSVVRLLAPGGIFVLQTEDRAAFAPAPDGLLLQERRSYGRTVFAFFGPPVERGVFPEAPP